MNGRIGRALLSAALVAGASVPVVSHANDGQALDQCVQMFVKEVVPADQPVQVRHDDISGATRNLSATRSTVKLVARGEKYGKLFGRASCVMDRKGSLVAVYVHDVRSGPMVNSRPKVLEPQTMVSSLGSCSDKSTGPSNC